MSILLNDLDDRQCFTARSARRKKKRGLMLVLLQSYRMGTPNCMTHSIARKARSLCKRYPPQDLGSRVEIDLCDWDGARCLEKLFASRVVVRWEGHLFSYIVMLTFALIEVFVYVGPAVLVFGFSAPFSSQGPCSYSDG